MTILDVLRPAWHADAACRGMGTELFFPDKGRSNSPAKQICAGCPVARICHDTAAANRDIVGVWGGTHWTFTTRRAA